MQVEIKMRKSEGLQWGCLETSEASPDNPEPQMKAVGKGERTWCVYL